MDAPAAVQRANGAAVKATFVDRGYAGDDPEAAVEEHGIWPAIVELPEAERGFVLLPRRWVVERSCTWGTRGRPRPRSERVLARGPAWRAPRSATPGPPEGDQTASQPKS